MIRALLIGLASGLRSLTPLAAVSQAARHGAGAAPGAAKILRSPLVSGGLLALALGELAGDKMRSAPDRTVIPGLIARVLTGGFSGAAMAPRRRAAGAALGVAGAIAGAYGGLALRKRAMRRYGQTRSGLVEDALTLAATALLVRGSRR